MVGVASSVAFLATACMVSGRPLYIGGSSNSFCDRPKMMEGSAVQCEDFSKLKEGTLPAGWMGGSGLAALASPDFNGGNVLMNFESRDSYKIDIPWKVSGDFVVTVYAAFGCSTGCDRGRHRYKIEVGNLTVEVNDHDPFGGAPTTVALQGASMEASWERGFHWIHINKKGNVYTLVVDSRQVLVGRYDGLPSAQSIAVSADGGGFALAGIRVESSAQTTP